MSDPNEKVNGNGIEQLRKAELTFGRRFGTAMSAIKQTFYHVPSNALCDTKMGTNR